MKKDVHKRINITLPETTVKMLERVADRGDRSKLIDIAIKAYIQSAKKEDLRRRLKEGAIARAERDLALANEWFDVENELWLR